MAVYLIVENNQFPSLPCSNTCWLCRFLVTYNNGNQRWCLSQLMLLWLFLRAFSQFSQISPVVGIEYRSALQITQSQDFLRRYGSLWKRFAGVKLFSDHHIPMFGHLNTELRHRWTDHFVCSTSTQRISFFAYLVSCYFAVKARSLVGNLDLVEWKLTSGS